MDVVGFRGTCFVGSPSFFGDAVRRGVIRFLLLQGTYIKHDISRFSSSSVKLCIPRLKFSTSYSAIRTIGPFISILLAPKHLPRYTTIDISDSYEGLLYHNINLLFRLIAGVAKDRRIGPEPT